MSVQCGNLARNKWVPIQGEGRRKGQGEGGGGEGVFATGQINGTIAALQIVINLSHCLIE